MVDPIDNPQFITDEPTNDMGSGANAGFGGQFTNYVLYGMYNSDMGQGPGDNTQDITPYDATDPGFNNGSNFMPNWKFVQSSNTNWTAAQVRDTASPSGSNFRFTLASGVAADWATLEAIVPIAGDRRGDFPHHVRTQAIAGTANGGTFAVDLYLQYLTVDGTITGMPAEQTVSSTIAAGATVTLEADATNLGIAPTNASKLRVKLVVRRYTASTSATGTIDFSSVRITRSVSKQIFSAGTSTWYKPAGATWVQVTCIGPGGGGGSGRRGAAGTVRAGGGGGGGGGASVALFPASGLPDTVTVTVGAGGAGAAARTSDSTNGNTGSPGSTDTRFYSGTTFYLVGRYGSGGGGGTTAQGAGGAAGLGQFTGGAGGHGGEGSAGAASEQGYAGALTAGGGGGAGEDAANNANFGANGNVPNALNGYMVAANGGSATNPGDPGLAPNGGVVTIGGGSGAGSGFNGGSPDTGGAGALGSGGGGGGGRTNGATGQAGGAGGDGYAAVIAW